MSAEVRDSREGPFYEDFVPGQKINHEQGRTITETDNIWFTLLTCNSNQGHYNKDYARRFYSEPPFNGKLLINSMLVLSIVLGLSSKDTSKNGMMLGMENWKVPNPVFEGDTIYARTEVISKRESKSHSTMGIVTVKTEGFNQDSIVVTSYTRSFMVPKKGEKWN